MAKQPNPERRMVFACVAGMLLCLALAARAEDLPAIATTTTAANLTVIVTPEPTFRERAEAVGFLVPRAEEVAICTNWFVAPMAFAYLSFPAHRALNDQRAWRDLPADKRAHFGYSAALGGLGSSLAFSFPAHADSSRWTWQRGAAIGGACLGIGLAKEAADEGGYRLGQRDHGAEAGDLAADAAGCAAGVATGAALGSAARFGAGLMVGAHNGAVGAQVGGRF